MPHRLHYMIPLLLVTGCADQTKDRAAPVDVDHEGHALIDCPHPPGPYPSGSPGWPDSRVYYTGELPTASDIGAFRVSCGFSHMNNDDPLVYPNQPGQAHLHTYFGNTGTNAYSTPQSLRSSGNSTCNGGIANRSAYWVPSLLENGQPLAPSEAVFYYKAGYAVPDASANVQLIPAGLRMIAGDAAATELQTDGAASWGCTDNYVGHHPQIVDCPVGDFLQMMITFPQCWNGVDLDSPDHKGHMAYPVEGACPSSHPVLLPEIMFNIRWQRTPDLDIGSLRLSSDCETDLPGGYSAHGDWVEAWEPDVRDTFVTQCINPSADCGAHMLGDGRILEVQP